MPPGSQQGDAQQGDTQPQPGGASRVLGWYALVVLVPFLAAQVLAWVIITRAVPLEAVGLFRMHEVGWFRWAGPGCWLVGLGGTVALSRRYRDRRQAGDPVAQACNVLAWVLALLGLGVGIAAEVAWQVALAWVSD